MTTLTKTRIEIADRHTSLCFLDKKPATPDPLGFGSRKGYRDLYEKIDEAGRANYDDLAGKQGEVLDKLYSLLPEDPDKPLKYWLLYLERAPQLDDVWKEAIPVLSTLKHRVTILPPANFPAEVKLKLLPQILLYPFGWSTWASVLVTGAHTIGDLSTLIRHLFQNSAFEWPLYNNPLTLAAHLSRMARGIRHDAFGGAATNDKVDADLALMITVLEKHNGGPVLDALGQAGKQQMLSLVRPKGSASRKSFEDLVFHFRAKGQLNYDANYLVSDQLGRFVWMEDLLKPEGTNQMKLECYHHNSFRALVQAWHFYGLVKYSSEGLLQQLGGLKKQSGKSNKRGKKEDPVESVMATAFLRLENFGYRNASLRAFLENDSIRKQVDASRKEAISSGLLTPDSDGNT